ncbi:MAG: S8 family peptidase [Bdellovibrionales bacterium]
MAFIRFKTFIVCVVSLGYSVSGYSQDAVPGEFIVRYKSEVSSFQALGKTSTQHNLKLHKSWGKINTYSLKAGGSTQGDDAQTLKDLRENPDVLYAEPNYYVKAQYSPLTGADVMAPQSWSVGFGSGAPVTVAVLDSGLNVNHSIFSNTGRLWSNLAEVNGSPGVDDDGNGYIDDFNGWNFLDGNNNLADGSGHGTHVAGIVVGSTEDISNVSNATSPRVKVMVLKFLDGDGVGTTSDAIDAIYYAVDNGAKILNNSWGGSGYSGALHEAIAYSFFQNTLFVAAAGNSGTNNDQSPIYPASYDVPSVLSVGATDDSDDLVYFSNFGASTVDLAAPGVNIVSASPSGGFVASSGTSMATPFTAGLAVLMAQEAPHFTGYQLKRDMMNSVDTFASLNGSSITGGRVNFQSAVNLVVANSSEATYLPDYTPVYQYSSRDLASLNDGEDGGFGCGRVKELYKNHNQKMGKKDLNFSNIFMMLLFALPLLAVRRARSKEQKRRYKRYSVEFKGFLKGTDGAQIDVDVFTFSIGGAGVRLTKPGAEVDMNSGMKLFVETPQGVKKFSCKAVSSFKGSLGLCFD